MRRLAIARHQTKTFTVSRAVRHAQIGGTFGDLPFGGAEGAGARAIRLEFQPTMRVRGNQPRNSPMILGIGNSSTSNLPGRVGIFSWI